MMYLLDASMLIRAAADYYPPDRVPEFWEWLLFHAGAGVVKVPAEILEEVEAGTKTEEDQLLAFLKPPATRKALRLAEEPNADLVTHVLSTAYAPDLSELELEVIGRDPFLIAYALADVANRTVVSVEVRANSVRAKRKIPNACEIVGVRCLNPFQFYKELAFATDWKTKLDAGA